MKKRLAAVFLALVLLIGQGAAQEQSGRPIAESRSFVVFTPRENELLVSYYINEDGVVFARIRDALKAGQTLKVSHSLAFSRPAAEWWWPVGENLATVEYTRFLKYDPLEDLYAFTTTQQPLSADKTVQRIQREVFSADHLQLMANTRGLQSGQAYTLKIRVWFEAVDDEKSLLNVLSLKQLWEPQTLEAEVTYIVPPKEEN